MFKGKKQKIQTAVYERSKFKKLCLNVFYFYQIFKCAKKNYEIRKLFCLCFILYKEKMLTGKATIES